MKNLKKIILTQVILWSLPLITFAQAGSSIIPDNPSPGNLPGDRNWDLSMVLTDVIRNILLPLAGLVAVLFIIIGGYRYIVSAGSEEQAEAGKKTLTNAVIGLVIIILSYVIVTVVATTLLEA